MENNRIRIKDKHDFEEVYSLLSSVVHVDNELPEQVFKTVTSKYAFLDFGWTMSSSFWTILQSLIRASQDPYVLLAVLDPSPTNYYFPEFGIYNWFRIPIDSSPDDYWNILNLAPEESPADSVLVYSTTVVWLSPSKKWAIWGDRAYGICVLAVPSSSDFDDLLLDPWCTLDEAFEDFLPVNFPNQTVPKSFSDVFRKNYSNS